MTDRTSEQVERDTIFWALHQELIEEYGTPKAIAERLGLKYGTYNRYAWQEGKSAYTTPTDQLLQHMTDVLKLIKIDNVLKNKD